MFLTIQSFILKIYRSILEYYSREEYLYWSFKYGTVMASLHLIRPNNFEEIQENFFKAEQLLIKNTKYKPIPHTDLYEYGWVGKKIELINLTE